MKHYASFFIFGLILSISVNTFSITEDAFNTRVALRLLCFAKYYLPKIENDEDRIRKVKPFITKYGIFQYKDFKNITASNELDRKFREEGAKLVNIYVKNRDERVFLHFPNR